MLLRVLCLGFQVMSRNSINCYFFLRVAVEACFEFNEDGNAGVTERCDPSRPLGYHKDQCPAHTHSRPTTHVFTRLKTKFWAANAWTRRDALVLYGSGDILAVGWLANWVRERMHGDKAYFNVNRHINPTNVCVAACRLCAFGRKKDTPGAYTMALEEAFADGRFRVHRGSHRVSHCRRTASRFAVSVFSRSGFRIEAALSASAHEGLHHG